MRASATATTWRTTDSEGMLRTRLGADIDLQTLAYGEAIEHHGVRVSLHPAGHVLGSAQVRLEHGGRVWVASGDYKIEPDGTCAPFEPVRCDTFITESTFGLPIYRWPTQAALFADINAWWRAQRARRAARRCCSAMPSARRSASCTASMRRIGPIVVHGAVEPLNAVYRAAGVALPPTVRVTDPGVDAAMLKRALVLAPPSAQGTPWMRRFGDYADAFASGWMQLRGARRRRGVDRGFVLSDHADWPGLQQAIARHGRRARVRHARQRRGDGALADARTGWRRRASRPSTATRTRRTRRRPSAPIEPPSGATPRHEGLRRALPRARRDHLEPRQAGRAAALLARRAAPEDAAWAVYFLAGGKPRQLVPTKLLRLLAQEAAGLPEWLFDESYEAVGDLAETIALLLPPPTEAHDLGPGAPGSSSTCCRCADARPSDSPTRCARSGAQLAPDERLVYFKLITGGFRVGVSKLLVTQALAAVGGVDAKRVAQRLMGYTHIGGQPTRRRLRRADRARERRRARTRRPAASPIPSSSRIRSTCRSSSSTRCSARPPTGWSNGSGTASARSWSSARGAVWLWSRGEELVTERFPELAAMGEALPDGTVIDGEIVVWRDGPRAALRRAAKAHRPQDAGRQAAARDPGRAARLRPARMARRRPARHAAARAPRAARRPASRSVQHPQLHRQPDARRRRLGRPGAPARSRARDGRRRHDAQAARRALRRRAAPRTSAPGGSGRSIRSASTRC